MFVKNQKYPYKCRKCGKEAYFHSPADFDPDEKKKWNEICSDGKPHVWERKKGVIF